MTVKKKARKPRAVKRKVKSIHKSHSKSHKNAHESDTQILIHQMKNFMNEISKIVKKAVGVTPTKRKRRVKHKK